MTKAGTVCPDQGAVDTGSQVFALKVGERYAVIKPDPESTGKKCITLFTSEGKKILFPVSPVSRGDKVVAFFPEGNPPVFIKCEEITDRKPDGVTFMDVPALSSGSMRTWLGTR